MTDYDNAIVAFIDWCKAEKRNARLSGDEGGDTFFAYETEQRWKVWLASWLARTPQPDAAAIRDLHLQEAFDACGTVAADAHSDSKSVFQCMDAINALLTTKLYESTTLVEPAIPTPSNATLTEKQDAPLAINVPDGWKLVPIQPTEDMVIAGFESVPDRNFDGDDYPEEYDDMSGCQQAAFMAKRCYAAMLDAASPTQSKDA